MFLFFFLGTGLGWESEQLHGIPGMGTLAGTDKGSNPIGQAVKV